LDLVAVFCNAEGAVWGLVNHAARSVLIVSYLGVIESAEKEVAKFPN
jgi:hypothetical protein